MHPSIGAKSWNPVSQEHEKLPTVLEQLVCILKLDFWGVKQGNKGPGDCVNINDYISIKLKIKLI